MIIGGGLLLGVVLAPLWIGLPILRRHDPADVAARGGRAAPGQPAAGDASAAGPASRPATGCARSSSARPYWRVAAMLLLKLPVALLGLLIALAPVLLAVALAGLGVSGLAGEDGRLVGPWELGPAVGIALCVLALPATIVSIAALEGVGAALRTLVRRLLRTRVAEGGPVRELLAERLGDRSLNIAYWLPEREIFVDDTGRQVTLPDPGSGRAWTAVDRGGVRLAAIVHDAELDACARARHRRRLRRRAGDRQRAPEGRAARPRRGAAGLAAADRRGRRRRPRADRAQPARRRPAAARRRSRWTCGC